jgi:hypothetical protein
MNFEENPTNKSEPRIRHNCFYFRMCETYEQIIADLTYKQHSHHTHALLLGFFRLVRLLQVIEHGTHWTAQDLEAELSKEGAA